MKNRYEIDGDVTRIFIVRKNGDEYVTLIDTEDLERVNSAGFSLGINFSHDILSYVRFSYKLGYLHRFILRAHPYFQVDHIDGNPLNNTKANLRAVTQSQNMQNQRDMPGKTRGVHRVKDGRYIASVCVDGNTKYLGIYEYRGHAVAVIKSYRRKHVPYSDMDKDAEHVEPNVRTGKAKGYYASYTKEKVGPDKWRARVKLDNIQCSAGFHATYEIALEAARLKMLELITYNNTETLGE